MTIVDTIRSRRNIKTFQSRPIPEEELHRWLDAASYAPNHKMNEPWRVLIIGPETRAKLNHKTDFGGAPLVLAVLSEPAPTPFARDENVMAVSCFVQNLLLSAQAAGASVLWTSIGASVHIRDMLGVSEGFDVVGVFGIGYPAVVPTVKPRTPITDKTVYLP